MKRKTITPKIRFEIFKRDSFTCQYCGQKSPDVILEVDHIKPVSKGGENTILNYVTSCKSCNIGKGGREISDQSELATQRKALDELQERRNQIEMMMEWKKSLESIDDLQVSEINKLIMELSGSSANDNGQKTLRKIIKKFGFEMTYDAVSTAFNSYYKTEDDWELAFNKIGGIANCLKNPEKGEMAYCNGILKNRLTYVNTSVFYQLYGEAIKRNCSPQSIMQLCKSVKNWTNLRSSLESYISENE